MTVLKICFTTNSSPWTKFHGGGQIFVHNLAQHLVQRGHEVSVIYTGPFSVKERATPSCTYNLEWAPYIGYPYTGKVRQFNAFTVYHKLRSLFPTHKFHIINSVGSEAFLLPNLCKTHRCPLFISIEHPNLSSIRPKVSYRRPLQTLIQIARWRELFLIRHACRRAAGIFTPSNFTKSETRKYFGIEFEDIKVVKHGLADIMLDFTDSRRPDAAKGPLLFFGRFEHQKGVDLLIKAYAILLSEKVIGSRKLVLVGSGPDEKKYRKLIALLGINTRVEILGWKSQREIKSLLDKAGLCVLPSRSESFGLTIAEVLSQGIPLVTTDAGSLPEVVDRGKAGWMANADNLKSLVLTIKEALENYSESISKAHYGLKHARDAFSWANAARAYEKTYLAVLSKTFHETHSKT